jgi:hypothetical protein
MPGSRDIIQESLSCMAASRQVQHKLTEGSFLVCLSANISQAAWYVSGSPLLGSRALLLTDQGDQGSPGRVCQEDVAVVCIAALDNSSESNRRTIELSAKPSDKQYTTAGLFTGTTADHEEATT